MKNKIYALIVAVPLALMLFSFSAGTISHGSGAQSCFTCHQGGSYRGAGLAVRNYLAPGKWQPGGGNVIAIQALAAAADNNGLIIRGDPRMEKWGAQVFFSDSTGGPLDVAIIDTDTNNEGVTKDTVVNGYTFVELTEDTLAWWANPVYFPGLSNALWSGFALSFQVTDTTYLGDVLLRADIVLSDEDGTIRGDIPITSIVRLRACVPLDISRPWQAGFPIGGDAAFVTFPGGVRFSRSADRWRVVDMSGRATEGKGAGEVYITGGLYVVQVGETTRKIIIE